MISFFNRETTENSHCFGVELMPTLVVSSESIEVAVERLFLLKVTVEKERVVGGDLF